MSNGLEEMAATFDPQVRDLASRTRHLIVDVYPEVVEVPWPKQSVAGYGIGPNKMSEHFCYIALHKDHVNLGFNQGAELPDPEGLLEGPGKLLRHTKITGSEEAQRGVLEGLLEAARAHRVSTRPAG